MTRSNTSVSQFKAIFLANTGLLQGLTDIEIWNSARSGNREAFGILFRRYYSLLYQFGLKICQDKNVLEDTIQELFTELWQKKPESEVRSVKAYLLQSLKFKLYRHYRTNRPTSEPEENGYFELGHDALMIGSEEDRQRIEKITSALDKLPARQKEIIYLKLYKGLEYEEVSQIMQVNYQVVRNLLCQALKNFRKLVQEDNQ